MNEILLHRQGKKNITKDKLRIRENQGYKTKTKDKGNPKK